MTNTYYPFPAPGASGQTVTVSTSGVSGTAYNPPTSFVWVYVKTDAVFVTFDGGTPAADNGVELPSGYSDIWSAALWNAAKFIRKTNNASVYAAPLSK